MREVCNLSAVSLGERPEYSSDIDYTEISKLQSIWATQSTLAIEEGVLACLLLDLDLSLDRGREGGSEFAVCMIGKFVIGKRLPPELG